MRRIIIQQIFCLHAIGLNTLHDNMSPNSNWGISKDIPLLIFPIFKPYMYPIWKNLLKISPNIR